MTNPDSSLRLKQATLYDQDKIYRWLACSDATPEMLGPPTFPDAPVPTYEEFCDDYNDEAFLDHGDFRLFLIVVDQEEIGAVSYFIRDQVAELDLWIASKHNWNKGYGSSALITAIGKLKREEKVDILIIRPSARNKRAVASYQKAGFEHYNPDKHDIPQWCLTENLDYEDAVVLVQFVNDPIL
ncbi:MAG: GNAT family N-acetyltransferase [Rhodobacteraceae bacterium]|nr:GNAT family N-acetyltransferase [Paracoccaceae bacterium]